MNLSDQDLYILCQTAIEAAQNAGQLINEYVNKNVAVQNKKGADSLASQVVTEVDVKAQNIILDMLEPTIDKYDLALLTEESVDDKSRFEKDNFWCIDPMDGTLAFTEKTPGYAVSIGLVSKTGEPQIGVVFDPVTGTLYNAIKGQGAFKNQKPWRAVSALDDTSTFHLYIDRSFLNFKSYQNILAEIKELLPELGLKNLQVEKLAGAVLNACWVIDNAPGCYFKIPKPQTGGGSLWDFAATACLFNEIGAYARSMDGSPLDLNRSDSTFMNHKGVLYTSNEEIASKVRDVLVRFPYEEKE